MIKSLSAFAFLLALTASANAQSLQQQMAKCVGLTGTLQRLACYDAVAHDAGVNAAPRTASAAPPPAYVSQPPAVYVPPSQAYVPPPVPAQRQTVGDFGAERLEENPSSPKKLERITAEVTAFHADPFGRFTVSLSNGQVWKQIEGDVTVASYRKTTRTAIIARSFLGSFALKFNDSEKMYKVTRVQ
jgi:hypothetical protein